MSTIPKDSASPKHVITHRRMQQRFREHQDKFDAHRAKGPMYAQALDDLEKALFGEVSREDHPSDEASQASTPRR